MRNDVVKKNELDHERDEMIRTFREENPELYAIYLAMIAAMATVPTAVPVKTFVTGRGTSGKSQ